MTRWLGSKRVILPIPRYTKDDVLVLKDRIETDNYRAVIDRRYPLESVIEATKQTARCDSALVFHRTEESFRWFENLVRKLLDELPDAAIDRLRMELWI